MTYSYDPARIAESGKDRMRFELGDTVVEGGADSCVLSDEEYEGALASRRGWLQAKLYALEAILFKLSYQVDTKIDVLSYDLGERAERWRKLHEELSKQVAVYSGAPGIDDQALRKPPYFYTDMSVNRRTL